MGCDGSRAEGPLDEPQAASVAMTAVVEASRKIRFMAMSSASVVGRGNLGRAKHDVRRALINALANALANAAANAMHASRQSRSSPV